MCLLESTMQVALLTDFHKTFRVDARSTQGGFLIVFLGKNRFKRTIDTILYLFRKIMFFFFSKEKFKNNIQKRNYYKKDCNHHCCQTSDTPFHSKVIAPSNGFLQFFWK